MEYIKTEYKFINSGFFKIKSRIGDEMDSINTSDNLWIWEDLGIKRKVDWNNFDFSIDLFEIAKGFLLHRFKNVSLKSVQSDITFFSFLSKKSFGSKFPWSKVDFIDLLSNAKQERLLFNSFKMFYSWGFKKQIRGFEKEFLDFINETKTPNYKPYAKVFLNPKYLTSADEIEILNGIDERIDLNCIEALNENILLQLSFELAPRPSQVYCLNSNDLEKTLSPNNSEEYFCINLPMTKKRNTISIEKRFRKISNSLGKKIEKLINLNLEFGDENRALFVNPKTGKRLSSVEISKIIVKKCRLLNLSQMTDPTLFRHHLAQSLADQGASAETISEILGHNSTLPARAYIASTPNIAEIKSKALGSNETYKELNSMFLTGEIIDRRKAAKERWVKGMVGSQYIGGIGACGLTENTACPKNPVYSCYTCKKFHPFIDGSHENVKENLKKQAQFFVDIAEKGLDLEHNRPVIQLERTIEAVDSVLKIIAKSK